MAPVRSYTNWNNRSTNQEEQREPYRKYFFICEGANTETWYFRKLIDIRLLEKTEKDRDISFPRKLIAFAESPKENKDIKISIAVSGRQEALYGRKARINRTVIKRS